MICVVNLNTFEAQNTDVEAADSHDKGKNHYYSVFNQVYVGALLLVTFRLPRRGMNGQCTLISSFSIILKNIEKRIVFSYCGVTATTDFTYPWIRADLKCLISNRFATKFN